MKSKRDLIKCLKSCKICTKREFSNLGIICSLTKAKPNFKNNCINFNLDENLKKNNERINLTRQDKKKGNSSISTWGYIGIAALIIRIVIRLIKN